MIIDAKSSAQLKREGVWPEFEHEMRSAESFKALEAVCNSWRPRMVMWSEAWKDAAMELKGQQIERLGGTLAQLKESVKELDAEQHDRDRWDRNLEDTNRGRW